MRHKLACHVDVDNLNMKVGAEGYHPFADAAQPFIDKEVIARGCKDKVVKDVGQCYESCYQADGQHTRSTEQGPS